MTNKAKKQINEVIYLSPPQEWLYKCDCPKCISGAHFDKEIAESYRKRGELNNEVARLRADAHNWHQHYKDERSTAQRWKEHCFKQVQEIERLHNVIRDEWPPDQAEEIIKNCKK